MPEEDELVLTFDPQTVDHLGARMYSHLPNAIAELVANAYDADATQVVITVGIADSISVADDGHGMSRQDVAEKYLRIGRNRRRAQDSDLTESANRRVSGKKGLGKLALFGIGKQIVLTTSRAGSRTGVEVTLSYDAMMAAEGEYKPGETTVSVSPAEHGTTVVLSDLKRRTPIDPLNLAASLSRLFDYTDSDFGIIVRSASSDEVAVNSALRLASVEREFEWSFPRDFADQDSFLRSNGVRGEIVSAKRPLRNTMRGITLYANGRMVNEPEFFGTSESSYAFSYLTGTLDVDFIDHVDNDVIATDRRAVDWEADITIMLREKLQRLLTRVGQEWRARRSEARRRDREAKIGMSTDDWIDSIKQEAERRSVRDLVDGITSDDLDLTVEQQGRLIEGINRLAPPNAEYVWRHLHPEIQAATKDTYERNDYFQAVQEAIKRYVNLARSKAGLDVDEAFNVMTSAFGSEKGKLLVFARYIALQQFGATSIKNIEEGQKHLSMGIVAGFRNPLAHEEIQALQNSGAFTYQDCLDALSIISHLVRRLHESELRQTST